MTTTTTPPTGGNAASLSSTAPSSVLLVPTESTTTSSSTHTHGEGQKQSQPNEDEASSTGMPSVELSEQMQRLIDMQYEQQLYTSTETTDAAFGMPPPLGSSSSDCNESQQHQRRTRRDSWGSLTNINSSESKHAATKTPYNSVRLTLEDVDETSSSSWLREVTQQHHISAAMSSNTPVSSNSPKMNDDMSLQLMDPTVGQGTLLFHSRPLHESGLPRSPIPPPSSWSPASSSSGPSSQHAPVIGGEEITPLTPKHHNLTLLPLSGDSPSFTGLGLTKSVGQHMNLASYGALHLDHPTSSSTGSITTMTSSDPQHEPPPSVVGTETTRSSSEAADSSVFDQYNAEHQEYLLLRQQQPISSTEVPSPRLYIHHHDDGYYEHSDPSYQHPYAASRTSNRQHVHRHKTWSTRSCGRGCWIGCCCTCLGRTLWNAVIRFAHAEALHRSLCYGAIDGMLTGSGIVATFCGLQLIDSRSAKEVHVLLVIFSLCACLSDSVGMAIGHVWTTHVAAAAQARERSNARLQFQRSKHTAKGHLVDLLLSRGMLKIDAMSLADTLEGYPDMFVAALAGEALVGDSPAPTPPNRVAVTHTAADHVRHDPFDAPPAASSSSSPGRNRPPPPPPYNHLPVSYRPPPPPHVLSYGRLSDYDMDPDAYSVSVATRESRLESICMMVSFTLFAILPALILNQVWSWSFHTTTTHTNSYYPRLLIATSSSSSTSAYSSSSSSYSGMNSFGGSNVHDHPPEMSPVISPLSLAISFGAFIMWCLGVWKSRFLDHSYWIWFGIEAVVVFGLCIATAFGLGTVLKNLLLPDALYVITTKE